MELGLDVGVGGDHLAEGEEARAPRRQQLRGRGVRPAGLRGGDRRPRGGATTDPRLGGNDLDARAAEGVDGGAEGQPHVVVDGGEAEVLADARCGAAGGAAVETGSQEWRSAGSKPARTSSRSATSATVRASGPIAINVFHPATDGSCGTSPKVGLNPTTPQNAAGMRIEPPPSPPSATGPANAATCAAAPPDEPPAVRPRSCGLAVTPNAGAVEMAL